MFRLLLPILAAASLFPSLLHGVTLSWAITPDAMAGSQIAFDDIISVRIVAIPDQMALPTDIIELSRLAVAERYNNPGVEIPGWSASSITGQTQNLSGDSAYLVVIFSNTTYAIGNRLLPGNADTSDFFSAGGTLDPPNAVYWTPNLTDHASWEATGVIPEPGVYALLSLGALFMLLRRPQVQGTNAIAI